jgi:hypothetical protein
MSDIEQAFKTIGEGVNAAMREFIERGTASALAYRDALEEARRADGIEA